MRLIDADELSEELVKMVEELNNIINTSGSWSIDYYSGIRKGIVKVYLLLNSRSITTKEGEENFSESDRCRQSSETDKST